MVERAGGGGRVGMGKGSLGLEEQGSNPVICPQLCYSMCKPSHSTISSQSQFPILQTDCRHKVHKFAIFDTWYVYFNGNTVIWIPRLK